MSQLDITPVIVRSREGAQKRCGCGKGQRTTSVEAHVRVGLGGHERVFA